MEEPKKRRRKKKMSLERKIQLQKHAAHMRTLVKPVDVKSDIRKQTFLASYYDPTSETYGNKYRSGLKAGFSDSYSKVLATPGTGNDWVKIDNYVNKQAMTPEHIMQSFERIALHSPKEENKIKALETLARIQGMMIEKKHVVHQNIDSLLNDEHTDTQKDDILDL